MHCAKLAIALLGFSAVLMAADALRWNVETQPREIKL
jgi:hypothetical protein